VSADDREAKALLNKFLGASVLMQGIEPLLQAQSSALVSQVEKQRLASAQVSVFTIYILKLRFQVKFSLKGNAHHYLECHAPFLKGLRSDN